MAAKNSNFLYLFATTAGDYLLGFGTTVCNKQLKKRKGFLGGNPELVALLECCTRSMCTCMDIDIVWKKEDLFLTILVR